jgi:ABC-type dipeptide/oligopeptide/nickel transport system permease component
VIRIITFPGHRLLFIVPQLFGILLVSFVLIKSVPGDPAVLMLGPMASAESVASLRTKLGLDHSLPVQFWQFLVNLAHGMRIPTKPPGYTERIPRTYSNPKAATIPI